MGYSKEEPIYHLGITSPAFAGGAPGGETLRLDNLLLRLWRGGHLGRNSKQDDLITPGLLSSHNADHIVFRSTSGRLNGGEDKSEGEVTV